MTKNIKILGSGCKNCALLTKLVKEVVAENNLEAEIEKIEDIMEIMKFDVMATPGLVVDGKVIVKGRVPSKEEIIKALK